MKVNPEPHVVEKAIWSSKDGGEMKETAAGPAAP